MAAMSVVTLLASSYRTDELGFFALDVSGHWHQCCIA